MEIKKCSKCGKDFQCKHNEGGCWCNDLLVPLKNLEKLREDYDNCLCPDCLKEYAITQQ